MHEFNKVLCFLEKSGVRIQNVSFCKQYLMGGEKTEPIHLSR